MRSAIFSLLAISLFDRFSTARAGSGWSPNRSLAAALAQSKSNPRNRTAPTAAPRILPQPPAAARESTDPEPPRKSANLLRLTAASKNCSRHCAARPPPSAGIPGTAPAGSLAMPQWLVSPHARPPRTRWPSAGPGRAGPAPMSIPIASESL